MNTLSGFALTALLLASPALAASSSHDHGHGKMSAGMPGKAADVSRTVKIIMKETEDGAMLFEPSKLTVKQGETISFSISNIGEIAHEFVLDDHHGIMKHKKKMEQATSTHKHNTPNSITLDPGENGSIVWTFTNSGQFEFACLIPGHYDAGMKGHLHVATE